MPYIVGIACLLLLWLIIGLASSFNLNNAISGEDGHPSTSKFQLLLWTGAMVFAYSAIEACRFQQHVFTIMTALPTNLLIAVGISGGTAVSAKAIAVNAAQNAARTLVTVKETAKIPATESSLGETVTTAAAAVVARLEHPVLNLNLSGILQGSDGKPDLGKLQIIAWTGFALVVFFARVLHTIHTHGLDLPDIDETQMVLMGIGHGTYIGKKIAEA